ncbi:MAG: hypothetical protein NKF70_11095 [Methanobacterium sp. ERen5]|nr:MAG: hypothetical protein NKF70_11095 [Methanobacterium sp. ERen5]
MDVKELVRQAERIKVNTQENAKEGLPEAIEFLRIHVGKESTFYEQAKLIKFGDYEDNIKNKIIPILNSFINYINSGLLEGISLERQAQIDIVSDFLDQANKLLNDNKVHPAAPTVIIGASLEEFLRNWVEETELCLINKNPSIDSYGKVLKENDLISKQDMKDITSWGGLRNHAAHGQWNEVEDRKRISLMLEGVNLFMRKYGKE